MKKNILIAIATAAIVIASAYIYFGQDQYRKERGPENFNASDNKAENVVLMQNFSFQPGVLSIKAGEKVVWTNNDNATHDVTSENFKSGNMSKGQSYEAFFENKGTFEYYCTFHPNMKGKIIVE